ncbi:MAG: hypothetical protein ACK4HW_04755 [Roseinatronobacter sp.]
MIAGLDAALADLAARQTVTTYGALAAQLGLDGPGRIARLTDALEASMMQDAQAGRPLRAARVLSRASDGLPARGFFQVAQALGLYHGPADGPEARAFHARQLASFTLD